MLELFYGIEILATSPALQFSDFDADLADELMLFLDLQFVECRNDAFRNDLEDIGNRNIRIYRVVDVLFYSCENVG